MRALHPRNAIAKKIPKRNFFPCASRDMYKNIPSIILCNSKTLDTFQMSNNGKMDKLWHIHPIL